MVVEVTQPIGGRGKFGEVRWIDDPGDRADAVLEKCGKAFFLETK